MLVTSNDAPLHETPNAIMRTLASPSLGASEVSVWEVTMRAGQRGPQHEVDREQVWTVLVGEFRVTVDDEVVDLRSGDALRLAPGASRQIAASTDARAMVFCPARPTATTTEGGSQVLPWAE